jgi:hypothetical protein
MSPGSAFFRTNFFHREEKNYSSTPVALMAVMMGIGYSHQPSVVIDPKTGEGAGT